MIFFRNVSLTAVQELVASLQHLKLLDCSFCDQLGEQGVCQLRAQVALRNFILFLRFVHCFMSLIEINVFVTFALIATY